MGFSHDWYPLSNRSHFEILIVNGTLNLEMYHQVLAVMQFYFFFYIAIHTFASRSRSTYLLGSYTLLDLTSAVGVCAFASAFLNGEWDFDAGVPNHTSKPLNSNP